MQLNVLVLDDQIGPAEEGLFKALEPFLKVTSQDDFMGRLERGEAVPLHRLPVSDPDLEVSFEFNQSSDPERVLKQLSDGRFRSKRYDLVLVDEDWGPGKQGTAGLNALLGAVLQHVTVHDDFLPAVVLWTMHWGDDRRASRLAKGVCRPTADAPIPQDVVRVTGMHKKDIFSLRILMQRLVCEGHVREKLTKAHEGAASQVRARAEANLVRRDKPIGVSEPWRKVIERAELFARETSAVLITGDSGTGKEEIASVIHDLSERSGGRFITVDCTHLQKELIESALFGHERGAFTSADGVKLGLVELAEGGTLFLDEIGEIGMDLQPKLLRFLEKQTFRRVGGTEERRSNARIVAATNRNLAAEVQAGRFRLDLYYRMKFTIDIPPLRHRKEDIRALASEFLRRLEKTRRIGDVSTAAWDALLAYNWPGNVRQLQNVLEVACVMAAGGVIEVKHLAEALQVSGPLSNSEHAAESQLPADEVDLKENVRLRRESVRARLDRIEAMLRDEQKPAAIASKFCGGKNTTNGFANTWGQKGTRDVVRLAGEAACKKRWGRVLKLLVDRYPEKAKGYEPWVMKAKDW